MLSLRNFFERERHVSQKHELRASAAGLFELRVSIIIILIQTYTYDILLNIDRKNCKLRVSKNRRREEKDERRRSF